MGYENCGRYHQVEPAFEGLSMVDTGAGLQEGVGKPGSWAGMKETVVGYWSV
jgi:hypothetical protein